MANSKLKCKQCKEYQPAETMQTYPIGTFCNDSCRKSFTDAAWERGRAKKAVKAKREQKATVKAAQVKHRADKERVKPLPKLLAETQAVINRYVRLRDARLGCVSCDKPASWDGQWHASHFHARGKSSRLRFHLWNIHKSCSVCNAHLSGNLRQYEPELIRRIGADKFDWMTANGSTPARYDPDYLRRMKRIFSKRCRLIEKGLSPLDSRA